MALDDELESGIPLGQDQAVESGQIQPPTLPLGIPYNPEGVVSSPYAAPVQAPPRVVIGSGPTPGLLPPNQRPLVGASPAAIAQERFRESNPNLPIDQAEAAYAAALRFQGQRAYEEDLQRGMPQAEAFAKNAMHMFASPKTTLAQAGAFMKDITPKPVTVSSPLGKLQSDRDLALKRGDAEAVKQFDAMIQKTTSSTAQNVGPAIDRIGKLQKQLDAMGEDQAAENVQRLGFKNEADAKKVGPVGAAADALRDNMMRLRNEVAQAGNRAVIGPATTSTVTSKAQYDALPSGAIYTNSNGKRYRKP